MKLPDYTALGSRPTPAVQNNVVSFRPVSGAEEAVGTAMMHAGNQMEAGSDTLAQYAKVEQTKIDHSRAEDAFSQVRERALDLTLGQQNGFMNLKGEAIGRRPTVFADYSGQLGEAIKATSAGLDNDQQRQLFKERADVAQYSFQHDLLNHITRERTAYDQTVAKGTIKVETQSAIAHWQDPNAIEFSLTRIADAVNKSADLAGIPKEGPEAAARQAALGEAQGAVWEGVVGQALASGNYKKAGEIFEAHKDVIDANTAKLVERALVDGGQKEVFNNYARQFIDGGRNLQTLKALEKNIAEDPTLDETRKNALLGRVESRRESLLRTQQAAADRYERGIERQINQVNTMTLMGYPPTLEQLTPLINAAKGTSLQGDVQRMVTVANETDKFRHLSPPQQEAYVGQLEAAARKDPTKFDVNIVNRFRAIQTNMKEEASKDPVGFVVRQGFVEPNNPGAAYLDFSKPETLGPQLTARFDLARQASTGYGVGLKPLQPAEVQVLSTAIGKMTAENKASFFGTLAKSAGNDRDGYRAMMNQIAPDDPVTAAGGLAAMRGLPTSLSIFRGQQYLNPPKGEDGKPVKGSAVLPKGDQLQAAITTFNSITGNAFEGKPGARNIYMQTAEAIYADKSVAKGDYSGVLDSRRWKESVNEALGGEPVKMSGTTVIVPPGMNSSDFRDSLATRIDALGATGRLPADVSPSMVKSLPLDSVGDGVYRIRSGAAYLTDKDGKAITIDFNQPAPVVSGGTSMLPAPTGETGGGAITGRAKKKKGAE